MWPVSTTVYETIAIMRQWQTSAAKLDTQCNEQLECRQLSGVTNKPRNGKVQSPVKGYRSTLIFTNTKIL